jgi:hypothetical protein
MVVKVVAGGGLRARFAVPARSDLRHLPGIEADGLCVGYEVRRWQALAVKRGYDVRERREARIPFEPLLEISAPSHLFQKLEERALPEGMDLSRKEPVRPAARS